MRIIALISVLYVFLAFPSQAEARKRQLFRTLPADSIQSLISRDSIIEFAKTYVGVPYRYAGSNPKTGFDCSGFVHYVFKKFNIEVPRSSREFAKLGTNLQPEEFKVGDVIIFYSFRNPSSIGHVGIICEANGMQSKFIHSSSGRKRGVIISNLESESYTRRFYKCIDILQPE
jgi:cell wall-associated NlpC family hydrolase